MGARMPLLLSALGAKTLTLLFMLQRRFDFSAKVCQALALSLFLTVPT
jgi:hypothetical protein